MEFRYYGNILWRWMWLIVLSTGIAAASSLLATSQQPRIYQSSTTLMVGQTIQAANINSGDIFTSQQLVSTYIQIIKTESVLQGVIDTLGLRTTTDQMRANINAAPIQGTQLLEVRVVDTDPVRAQFIANEVARQLILQGPAAREDTNQRSAFVQKQVEDLQSKIQDGQSRINDLQNSIQATSSAREIADKQQQVATLQTQLTQWQTTYASLLNLLGQRSPSTLTVMESARLPRIPISPNVPATVLLATAIGFLLAVGGAILIEYIDDTIKLPDDVTRALNLPVLGIVARIAGDTPEQKLITAKHPRASHSEAFRVLRTNIQVADVDNPIRTLLVTSANPVEGKSVTTANLAVVMAQAGLRAVLVDADMRRPSQHRMFEVSNDYGLTNGLTQADANADGYLRDTAIENLRLVTTGPIPPNPAELLGSHRMEGLVKKLKDDSDIVLIDTPPCLPLADAAILARKVDGVLLVVDAGKTRREAAVRAKETLERAGGRILGVLINHFNARSGGGSYYYYYYYYYSNAGKKGKRKSSSNHSTQPLAAFLSKLTRNSSDGSEQDD